MPIFHVFCSLWLDSCKLIALAWWLLSDHNAAISCDCNVAFLALSVFGVSVCPTNGIVAKDNRRRGTSFVCFHCDPNDPTLSWWRLRKYCLSCQSPQIRPSVLGIAHTVLVKSLDTPLKCFLYCYYFLHCRLILKTFKLRKNTYGMMY